MEPAQERRDPPCMKPSSRFLPPALLLLTVSVFSQPIPQPLLQARQLSEQGQSRLSIPILEPLVQPDSHVLDEANLGIAWNLLGAAYADVENFDKARHCFENAIHILRQMPGQQVQYATALDNLGALEASANHFDEAKSLHSRAKRLYQDAGYHAGVVVSSSNLTMANIMLHDLRAARASLDGALRETQLATDLTDANRAVFCIAKGSLARAESDFHGAVAAFQLAIDLWTRIYGPRYFMLGVAYALRGLAYEHLGDYPHSLSDYRQALALFEETPGRNTPSYLQIEMAYARTLRVAGSKQEAARVEQEARSAMADVRVQQCSSCTISAESFRARR
jgi:tetratricopeptide (TPR) repeat protein